MSELKAQACTGVTLQAPLQTPAQSRGTVLFKSQLITNAPGDLRQITYPL